MRKNIIETGLIVALMLAVSGCGTFSRIPPSVWEHAFRIGISIADEYSDERVRIVSAIRDVIEDVDRVAERLESPKFPQYVEDEDLRLFLVLQLEKRDFPKDKIDRIVERIFPAPDDVQAYAVEVPGTRMRYLREIKKGIENGGDLHTQ